MPIIQYDNQTLRVDHLYSYGRVSADQETIKSGGESLPRQLELHQEFAQEHGIPTVDLDGSQLRFIDDGVSGSKGHQLRDGAGLAAFMAMAKAGKLKSHPALTVESFTRLGRLPIDLFNKLFWEIIEADVILFTLKDKRAYSKESVRRDKGQVYQIQAMMQAANSYAEDLAFYSAKSWTKRRGTATALAPSWFDKYALYPGATEPVPVISHKGLPKGSIPSLEINPDKHPLIQRIFTEVLTMGVNLLAFKLNAEGKPLLSGRKGGWSQSGIATLIRSRMVLGEQQVGKYVNGKRTFNGEVIKDAYDAVVTEEQWQLANAALDGRKRVGEAGRNVAKVGNLFGKTARCDVCGGPMKIKQGGRVGEFDYFACSAAGTGMCKVKGYHRLDHVEAWLFGFYGRRPLGDWTPEAKPEQVDPTIRLNAMLAKSKAQAAQYAAAFKRLELENDPLSIETRQEFKAEHAKKLIEVRQLEHELTAQKASKPVVEQIAVVKSLGGALDGLKGDDLIAARRQIARVLPSILPGGLRFKAGGGFAIYPAGYSIHFPKAFTPDMLDDWDRWVVIEERDANDPTPEEQGLADHATEAGVEAAFDAEQDLLAELRSR